MPSPHDIVTAVLVVLALITGMCIGRRIEHKRMMGHVPTLFPQFQSKQNEPIPDEDL